MHQSHADKTCGRHSADLPGAHLCVADHFWPIRLEQRPLLTTILGWHLRTALATSAPLRTAKPRDISKWCWPHPLGEEHRTRSRPAVGARQRMASSQDGVFTEWRLHRMAPSQDGAERGLALLHLGGRRFMRLLGGGRMLTLRIPCHHALYRGRAVHDWELLRLQLDASSGRAR